MVSFQIGRRLDLSRRHLGAAAEDARQVALVLRIKMHDHHKTHPEALWECLKESLQGTNPAGGCANSDNRRFDVRLRYAAGMLRIVVTINHDANSQVALFLGASR